MATTLNLVRPSGETTTIDPATLDSDLPVLLYNVDDNGEIGDFNPQNDAEVAWFTLYSSGLELEFIWDDQDDETQTLIRDLENPS